VLRDLAVEAPQTTARGRRNSKPRRLNVSVFWKKTSASELKREKGTWKGPLGRVGKGLSDSLKVFREGKYKRAQGRKKSVSGGEKNIGV